jgi:hypothetical protein
MQQNEKSTTCANVSSLQQRRQRDRSVNNVSATQMNGVDQSRYNTTKSRKLFLIPLAGNKNKRGKKNLKLHNETQNNLPVFIDVLGRGLTIKLTFEAFLLSA